MNLNLKIAAVIGALLLAVTQMSAQVGIEGGYMGTMYKVKTGENEKASAPMNGFYVGVNDEVRIVAGLAVQPGLYYSYGTESESKNLAGIDFTGNTSEHNINIPVHLKYTFDLLPVLGIYVYGGPTLTVGLVSREKLSVKGNFLGSEIDGSLSYDNYSGKFSSSNLSESVQNEVNKYVSQNQLSRFDVMLGGGVGLNLFKFITVKGGYDYGFINRYKGDLDDQAKCNRSQFYVSVGIRF